MPKDTGQFNPEMLTLTREAGGFTQSALAEVVGFSQSKISKIEDGSLPPSPDDLLTIAKAVGQPVAVFHRSGKATASTVSFYRKTTTFSLGAFKQCNARMNLARIQLQKLLARDGRTACTLPYLPVEKNRTPSAAARELRKAWGLSRGAIPNLTELVEDAGCVVVHFDFGTKKIDGLCLWAENEIPFVFLNTDFPATRMRLTLGHELGHLIMHRVPHEKVEEEAWEFASELLMPEAEIRRKFFPANLDTLCKLKLEWRVSMQALLKRGESLGEIPERYARYLWMHMGKMGYRIQEPYDDQLPREVPKPLLDENNEKLNHQ